MIYRGPLLVWAALTSFTDIHGLTTDEISHFKTQPGSETEERNSGASPNVSTTDYPFFSAPLKLLGCTRWAVSLKRNSAELSAFCVFRMKLRSYCIDAVIFTGMPRQ